LDVGQSAFYTTLRKLMNAGLIIETRGERFPFPRFFTLSDKGRRITEHLIEIERILKE